MRKSLILAAALTLIPAVSQAKTLEDLLVEKGVITRAEARSAASSASASKVYWNEGTRFEFPDAGFTSGFATYLVERYTFTDAPEEAGKRNSSSFEQKRARLILSGTALNNEFTYYMSTDFVGEKEDGEAVPSLKDAYVQWNACDWAAIRMGQYKTFISKQWNVSEHKTQLLDRSVASEFFNLDRAQGLSTSFWTEDKSLSVKAGVFNGNSAGEGVNRAGVDTDVSGMLAVRYNPLGAFDVSDETDINNSEDLGLSFGAAYAFTSNTTANDEDVDDQRLSVDAAAKVAGFSTSAEFFYQDTDGTAAATPLGFYLQGGYFVEPKTVEIAARYSYVDCDNGEAGGDCEGLDKINEVGAAVNYYWWKHYLKASVAYSFVNEDTLADDDYNTNKWMFQLSSYF